jgi:hypothetical protein
MHAQSLTAGLGMEEVSFVFLYRNVACKLLVKLYTSFILNQDRALCNKFGAFPFLSLIKCLCSLWFL